MPAEPMDHQIRLEKNGETVQNGNTRDFLTPLEDLIAFISTYFTLKKGRPNFYWYSGRSWARKARRLARGVFE